MSSIGNYYFVSMVGPRLNGFRRGTEIIDRKDVDGLTWRQTARKNTSVQKTTMAGYATLIAAEEIEAYYAELINYYVTVVEPNGAVWYDVLVEGVVVNGVTPVFASSVPGLNYLVEAVWTLRRSY